MFPRGITVVSSGRGEFEEDEELLEELPSRIFSLSSLESSSFPPFFCFLDAFLSFLGEAGRLYGEGLDFPERLRA
jgi:hypothetical protein